MHKMNKVGDPYNSLSKDSILMFKLVYENRFMEPSMEII